MKINHGVVAYRDSGDPEYPMLVVHFVGYENEPSDECIKHLMEELNTDEDFNLVGRMGVDTFLCRATPAQVEYYRKHCQGLSDEGS
jgi:hypothetical protein